MNKTKKNLVLAGAWILIISGIITAIMAIFNNFFTNTIMDFVLQILNQFPDFDYTEFDLNEIKGLIETVLFISFIISSTLSIVLGIVFIFKSKLTEEEFNAKSTSYIVLAIIALLVCGLVPGILLLCALIFNEKKIDENIINEFDVNEQDKMIKEVEKLKKLKENNLISEEEYSSMLEKILK